MIVRKMNPHEIDNMMILADYYRDEAEIPLDEYDENSIMASIKQYASLSQYFLFVAMDGTRPVGLIAGYMTPTPWNKKLLNAHCQFIFLLKSHRTMENFRMLYQSFEEWGRMNDVKQLTAGDIGINFERSEKLWTHLGFVPECWMSKELTYE
jgi:hypothetical protein